jgi:hypothetical protein
MDRPLNDKQIEVIDKLIVWLTVQQSLGVKEISYNYRNTSNRTYIKVFYAWRLLTNIKESGCYCSSDTEMCFDLNTIHACYKKDFMKL